MKNVIFSTFGNYKPIDAVSSTSPKHISHEDKYTKNRIIKLLTTSFTERHLKAAREKIFTIEEPNHHITESLSEIIPVKTQRNDTVQ